MMLLFTMLPVSSIIDGVARAPLREGSRSRVVFSRFLAMESGSDSDAPEELTAEQGFKQNEEIQKIQMENKIRVKQEIKERRRLRAQKKAEGKFHKKDVIETMEADQQQEASHVPEMLPSNIVELLAAREKLVFASDSEEQVIHQEPQIKKKKRTTFGPEMVLLKDIPPPQCVQSSMDFLKKKRMQVARSNSVLKNANQALRLVARQSSRQGLNNAGTVVL